FLLVPRPLPRSTLFPYTTLFRSRSHPPAQFAILVDGGNPVLDELLLRLQVLPRDARVHFPLQFLRSLEIAFQLRISKRKVYAGRDRKSTRLNSSHEWISYAVFCL